MRNHHEKTQLQSSLKHITNRFGMCTIQISSRKINMRYLKHASQNKLRHTPRSGLDKINHSAHQIQNYTLSFLDHCPHARTNWTRSC